MAQDTPITVAHGDGIGPEIMAATLQVLREVDRLVSLGLTFEEVPIGFPALKAHGSTLPDSSFEAGRRADGVILGPVSHNDYPPAAQGGINPSGALRKRLDLFANIRPAKTREGFPARCGKPVDLVVVRENTEGFYADRNMFAGSGEFMPTKRQKRFGCVFEEACNCGLPRLSRQTISPSSTVFLVTGRVRPLRRSSNELKGFPLREISCVRPFWITASERKPSYLSSNIHSG